MASGFKGISTYITSIGKLRKAIKEFPLSVRESIARDAHGWLTNETRDAFFSGRTVYETPRPASVDRRHTGEPLSLIGPARNGRHVLQDIGWTNTGTIIRALLNQRYARYLVGQYKILPNNKLPASWQEHLESLLFDYGEDMAREQSRQLAAAGSQ